MHSRGLRAPQLCALLLFGWGVPNVSSAAPGAPLHIRLEASTPGRNEVLTTPPASLRLLFSARIEESYTSLTLIAPDGTQAVIGAVTFIDGSDREITAAVPPLEQPEATLGVAKQDEILAEQPNAHRRAVGRLHL